MVVGKGFPGLKAPGIWGVAGKLWLAFGLLVLVLAVSGLVSYRSIQQIDRDLRRFVAVEEPLERAALEMEINAGEGARAVLDYVRELAPEHIEARRDSEADFERFSRDFERLAETDDERRLGREVAGLHGVFKALGDEIVGLSDLRRNALETFRRDVLEIDELIDGKLQKALDTTAHEGMMKLHSTLDMEINIFKAFAAIEGYAARPDPTLRLELEDAEADFERYETIYRETSLSTKEKGWLDQIDRNFAEAVMAGERIMTVTDGLNTRLEEFEQHLAKIDAILDNQIQPLIHAETVAAAADAKTSTDLAALYLILLGLMGLCVAIAAAWVISRAIIGPIRALVSGAEIVGGGDLAHRIEAASRDEFGHLARAFNAMVENLARALRRIEDAREQLEGRVAERTRDLTSELAARARAEEALREARDSLERRVRERTAELRKTNAELEKEVTERKRIETEQRRMAAVVRDSHDAITMQDFSGQIIAWNRGAEAMYGYSEAEALKMNARDLMPEDKRAEAEEIALANTRGEDVSVFRTQRRAKDGRLLEVSLTVTLLVGEHGKPVGLATTERDITERKRAEDALLASEERLAEILDIAPEGVITVDGNGRIELFNKGAEAIFGHSAQEMIGQTLDRLIPTRFRDIHHKHLEEFKTMSRGQHVMGLGKEILGLRKDGTEFPAEAVISKLESGGQTTFMVMMYDITERKRVEQQLTQSQKMEAIGQLTGGIAHDFNNLLMIIDGYARRTLSNIGDVEIAGRSLEEVLAATEKAANLTKQLLGFSRRQIMDKQVFPVAESVSELKRLLEQSVGEQHELEFEISDKKVCVHTDPGELSQAILNLAINARDAMPEGGKITIGVRVIGGDAEFIESDENTPEESFVEISVTDKGCGIDENTMEHIFEPFFTTKEQGQGTGLGLSMAYGFARQSGGKLEVISSVSKGTTLAYPVITHTHYM